MLVNGCRREVIRRLQDDLSVLGGSSLAKRHGCSARCFILYSFLLLALLAPVHGQDSRANELRYQELPNFGRVNEKLYRGGQPRKGGVRRLAALGVNTIINLRDDDESALVEAQEAKAEGLQYFNVPFKRLGRPSDSQIDQVLSLIDAKENGVVFVHCHHGSDRTGTVIAVYRISHDQWTDTEAKREAERFGMKFWQQGMKDYVSDYYRVRAARPNQPKKKASLTLTPQLEEKRVLSGFNGLASLKESGPNRSRKHHGPPSRLCRTGSALRILNVPTLVSRAGNPSNTDPLAALTDLDC